LTAGIVAALLCAMQAWGCDTLEACLARYPEVATVGAGVSVKGQELAKAVQAYGAQAIPGLLKLLENGTLPVRTLAGYTLRDIDGLGPEHLDALMRARRMGDGWIPPAIARIGTPEAVEFLINDLRKKPQAHTQVTGALAMLGAKAAPGLAEFFACVEHCDEDAFQAASSVLYDMEEEAAGVAPRLLQIARDRHYALQARQYAVRSVGYMRRHAEPYVPQLNELRKQDPALGSWVDEALTGIGSADALPALLRQLPVDAEGALAQISSLRTNGYSAGRTVLKYLDDPRWAIRVAAANTLGDIGYAPAESALVKLLANEDDWKLVYSAVLSLGHLKARGSLDSLGRVRDSHWYPPVRSLAAAVVEHIESGAALIEPDWWQDSAIEGSPRSCASVRERSVAEPKGKKLYSQRNERELEQLTYDSTIVSYDAAEGTAPDKNGVMEINQDNLVEHVEKIRQVPDVALKVADGWLVGADRGEWGGELVHLPASGASQVVYDENIDDIFLLGNRLVATTGLAHMISNSGFLLRVDKNDTGRYRAVLWKRLPAAPESSWLIEGGRLLVNTLDGGSVIIDANGGIRMAKCRQTQSD